MSVENKKTTEPFARADDARSDISQPVRVRVGFLFLVEASLLMLTFAAMAAGAVPGVNESHYWTKAKSFWDPSYCPNDLFLQSADAHLVFYWTLGWLVVPFSLPVAVWVARWIIWVAMALGWTYLSRSIAKPFGVAILSGGLLVVLTRWFHLAGEWVVGGAEAKGLAFACVFVAIGLACQRRWIWTWIWGGAAAAFHVLVGGWMILSLMLAAVFGRFICQHSQTRGSGHLLGLAIGGAISLFGLVPALTLNWNVPASVANSGAEIYATQRIAHHLAIWAFSPFRILAFAALLVVWILIANRFWQTAENVEQTRVDENVETDRWPLQCLLMVSIGSLAIAIGGIIIGVGVLESDYNWTAGINLLRYYWFRCSDVAVPMFVALAPFGLAYQDRRSTQVSNGKSLLTCVVAFTLVLAELGIYWREMRADERPGADQASLPGNLDGKRAQEYYRNWRKVCDWVERNTAEDAMFLTPRSQQTFKWYASRAEVICWKDVPQDSASLLEWRRRAADCFPHTESEWGFAVNEPEALARVIKKYKVDYLLIPQYAYELKDRFGRPLPYPMVYPESTNERSTFVVLKTR